MLLLSVSHDLLIYSLYLSLSVPCLFLHLYAVYLVANTILWNPSLATLDFSLIIPCYNEEKRLPVMIAEVVDYFKAMAKRKSKKSTLFKTWEIIVVDDGSRDDTVKVALELAKEINEIKVLVFEKNRGKGGAVMQVY